ncbi:ankyrin repeat-containing protein [Penicillium lividum]|nr:ankyrin repeat-containing protein [Penicillium lividum]
MADINALPSEKEVATALPAAARHGYYSLVLRLLRDGADVTAAPSAISGRTAIDGAAETGRPDILQLL